MTTGGIWTDACSKGFEQDSGLAGGQRGRDDDELFSWLADIDAESSNSSSVLMENKHK